MRLKAPEKGCVTAEDMKILKEQFDKEAEPYRDSEDATGELRPFSEEATKCEEHTSLIQYFIGLMFVLGPASVIDAAIGIGFTMGYFYYDLERQREKQSTEILKKMESD